MKARRLSRVSLLWKILLSTSIAITIIFAVTGWIVQDDATRITRLGLEEEVQGSFHAYESLWQSRADKLTSISLVLSRMSDVRAAFGTGDQATIRDTAGELWDKISRNDAFFLVTDPRGAVIASLGGLQGTVHKELPVVRSAAARFPKQASGFLFQDGHLYQVAVTPVYVSAGREPALLNVLVAGYAVDASVARQLKDATGGSDFVFLSGGNVIASTLDAARSHSGDSVLAAPLPDVTGKPIGELRILRSFDAARRRIATLRQNVIVIWFVSMVAGIGLTYILARRILQPVQQLDRAATQIGHGNYDTRVDVESGDELGRLARTFNAMCASLKNARDELIRQERIATIGRLSTSIVHDLRNPLAAIYGGAEMLVDDELSATQVKRLAANIYRSSRRVQELLQDLVDVTRGRTLGAELCRLSEVVGAAHENFVAAAETQQVSMTIEIPEEIELPLERSRMERVFGNLIDNALEAMPNGGAVHIWAEKTDDVILVSVKDNGPGISEAIASRLFQPFVSAGKKNGLGLGLALSRQTVLDHGGELWVKSRPGEGACFFLRLPR
jgi:signal transduction histidine kinase